MTKIFISYRKLDSAWAATKIYDFIRARLKTGDTLYMDWKQLRAGGDFEKQIKQVLAECDVVLALIGPSWLKTLRERQASKDIDYVRMELAIALDYESKNEKYRVIPVLLDGAQMPHADDLPDDLKRLPKMHALSVGQPNFEADATRVAQAIGGLRSVGVKSGSLSLVRLWPMALTLMATAAIVALQHFLGFEAEDTTPTLIGLGSLGAGIVAAAGHSVTASRSGGIGAFAVGLLTGAAATAAMIMAASYITADIGRDIGNDSALFLSQLTRDVTALVAGAGGYLSGKYLDSRASRSA